MLPNPPVLWDIESDPALAGTTYRLRVSNNGDDPAQAWVTTTLGMNAVMGTGDQRVAPPWAQ